MRLFTFKEIVPRLIEQDDVITLWVGAENGSCLGRWNGLRRPCLSSKASASVARVAESQGVGGLWVEPES